MKLRHILAAALAAIFASAAVFAADEAVVLNDDTVSADNTVITQEEYTDADIAESTVETFDDMIDNWCKEFDGIDADINLDTGELTIYGGGIGNLEGSSQYSAALFERFKTVTICSGVITIKKDAFLGMKNVISITIPDSVTSIDADAFDACKSLKSITVSSDNKYYKSYNGVLYNADMTELLCWPRGITKSVSIPSSVTSVGDYAFHNCDSYTSITLPDSITSIKSCAFYVCGNLTSITIPDSVASISDNAFNGCKALTEITIPASVTSIGDKAFKDCTKLAKVTFLGDVPSSFGKDVFDSCADGFVIYYPDTAQGWTLDDENKWNGYSAESVSMYKYSGTCGDNLRWTLDNDGNLVISGSGAMADYAGKSSPWYTYRLSIKSVVIKSGVSSIGNYAFQSCSNLTNITIPDSVTSIGTLAFQLCSGLTNITIPDSVASIGSGAFNGCKGLTSITIPSGVTSISNGLFTNCSNLTGITLPDGVTSIGDSAFSGTGLTSLIIPDSVTSIGSSVYSSCTGLTNITIPDRVTSIGDSAFYMCTALTDITFGEGLDSIGTNAFSECSGLTIIVLPDGLTSIGSGAFGKCSNLTSVTIPDSVTTIKDSAFAYCSKLTEARFLGDAPSTFGTGVFGNSSSVFVIYYPSDASGWETPEWNGYKALPNTDSETGACLTGTCGENITWSLNIDTHMLTISGSGDMENYDYASSAYAPWYNSKDVITSIVFEGSIESIGDWAFSSFSSLETVLIPDTVTIIGNEAFSNCGKLKAVSIGNGVTYIGSRSFVDCDNLRYVTLGKEIATIGDYAFFTLSDIELLFLGDCPENLGVNIVDTETNTYTIKYFTGDWSAISGAVKLSSPFTGMQAVLGGSISAVFVINPPTVYENMTIKVKVGDGKYTYIDKSQWTMNTGDDDAVTYSVPCVINAAEMKDTIVFCVCDGNGMVIKSQETTVGDYSEVIKTKYSSDTKMTDLVDAMLLYGAQAQTYFGHNDTNLASSATVPDVTPSPESISNCGKTKTEVPDLTYYGSTLMAEDKIGLRHYFIYSGDISELTFCYIDNNESKTLTPVKKGNYYYVEIPDIDPTEYDTEYVLHVTKDGAETIITYSVNYAVYKVLNNVSYSYSDNFKNFMKALYNYGAKAEAYVQ